MSDDSVQLRLVGIVDAPVHQCATNLVSGHVHGVSIDCIVDELVAISGELLQERLDEVVSFVVF